MKTRKQPTAKQVESELKALRELLPKIRPYSAFGDDNRAKVRIQIEVLEEDLDEDTIYNREDNEWTTDEVSVAMCARQWLDGDEDEAPSDGWRVLVIK